MLNARLDTAEPRKSTWETYSVAKPNGGIPYVYKDSNGKDCYEVCDGKYLLAIDEDGILQSCTFRDPDNPENVDIIVPNKVGNIVTTGIASGSFDKDTDAEKGGIKQYITSLVFEDDSKITTIEDGVFSGCPLLESVVIGNTIKSIGANAFANCGTNIRTGALEVTFHTPAGGDYAGFSIGTNAFTTGGKPLLFAGDVVKGYAPFEHAMNPETQVTSDGLRICYKSLSPQNLVVIQDNETHAPTLVDYPHYDAIDDVNEDYIDTVEKAFIPHMPQKIMTVTGRHIRMLLMPV